MNPKKMASNISYGAGWTEEGLGTMARKDPANFMARSQELIDKGELTFANVSSLRHLFNSLWDVQVQHLVTDALGNQRTITSSAFPLLTGGLVVREVQVGMEGVPTVGQDLVTEISDNKKWTHISGLLVTASHQQELKETQPFPEIGVSEEKYSIGHRLNGYKMSITGQAIEENEVADIVSRCNQLGEIATETIEELTLERVTDHAGSATSPAEPYVLRLNGSGTSLYTTSNSTLTRLSSSGNRYTNNALTDETDLENVRLRMAGFTNERGKRVNVPASQCVLLVPVALESTGLKILNSELVPGNENELNAWGPRGAFRPRLITTSKLDDISTSAWYYGDFKKQFVRKTKLAFENASLGGTGTQLWLDQRIAAQFRLAWDIEVGARAYQYVIQSLSGTTAP